MKTRVISGVILVILLILTLVTGGYITAVVLLLVSLIGYREISLAIGVRGKDEVTNLPELIGILAVCIHYILLIYEGGNMLYLVCVIMGLIIAEGTVFVFKYPVFKANQFIGAIFAFLYAPMMLSFIYLLRAAESGIILSWFPFVAWVCDTCAYFAGSALGKHKLCPILSPKKTIEGAIGGIAGSVIAGAAFGYVYATYGNSNMPASSGMITFAIIALVASALSQVGDLIASGIKRDHDIKDYGKLIPGHGGIMDRFDSVIFITPVIYFLAKFFMNI